MLPATGRAEADAPRAEQELRTNTARVRRVNGDPAALELRRTIAERNGRLTSALLRWRPRSTDGPPTYASANGGSTDTSTNGGSAAAPVPVAVVELGVEDRSSMTKAELIEALRDR